MGRGVETGIYRDCAGKAPPVNRREGTFLMMVSISKMSLVRAVEDDKNPDMDARETRYNPWLPGLIDLIP